MTLPCEITPGYEVFHKLPGIGFQDDRLFPELLSDIMAIFCHLLSHGLFIQRDIESIQVDESRYFFHMGKK